MRAITAGPVKNANPVSRAALLASVLVFALTGCGKRTEAQAAGAPPSGSTAEVVAPSAASGAGAARSYGYEVVHAWPHDRGAFTQGLVFENGRLFESTGQYGQSSLREVELTTGRVLRQTAVPAEFFAEGLALLGGKAYQLTWQNRTAFVYDRETFQLEKKFTYAGEGWGLATDGKSLILSDGTAQLRFLDPVTFAVQRTILVTLGGIPVSRLNELEWVRGEIYANVWQTDTVVIIDPASGRVTGNIDLRGLLAPQLRDRNTDVLNGVAYDAAQDRLFVTGKNWPQLFEVKLKARN